MGYSSIVIFTCDLDGGAFTNLPIALVKGFWKLGVRELYIVYLHSRPNEELSLPSGVKLVSLGVERSIAAPIALAKFLKATKPDVLISMPTFISIPAIMGWLLSGQRQTKFVVYQGDTLTSDITIEHSTSLKMRIMPWLARLMYPAADGLTTVSKGVLDILIQDHIPIPRNRVAIIPNPVDLENFAAQSQSSPEHPWLINKDSPVIVSLGRLVKRKNYPLLLQAFANIRHQTNARLILLGEGPERSTIELKALELGLQNDVSLPGHVANPWSNIASADLFVMSSLDEAFCLALVEAMICGVPVISTDAIGGGPRDILEEGKYGNLVPCNDPDKLAEVMLKVLTDSSFSHHLATVGKERCEAFKPEAIAQQWLTFLQQL